MARWQSKSYEFYRAALLGDKDNIGLREAASGFNSRDGFNLRNLTTKQKKAIEAAHAELDNVTAQFRFVWKPKNRSKKELSNLDKALRVTQSGTQTKWKVAFLPTNPRYNKHGKLLKPRVYFGKDGVRIREPKFSRVEIPLDQVGLVKNSKKEITQKVKDNAPGAQRFTIQAGPNEMPVMSDLQGTIARVNALMAKYDGKKALPRSSGNFKDDPKNHHFSKWLNGIVAYDIDEPTPGEISKAAEDFRDANKRKQLDRANKRKALKRKEGKRKKKR